MSKRGLGKGLDALLSTSSFAREKQHIASHSQELSADGELTDLAIGQLQPGVYQPRKDMAPEALEELAASIQSQGIIQPIVVRQVESGQFEIIAGERRWRAFQTLKIRVIPARVVEASNASSAALGLIENLQREGLNAIEEAQGYSQLIEQFQLTQEVVSTKVGKSRAVVANALRLLKLAPELQGYLRHGQLSVGHAKVILGLAGEAEQKLAAERVLKDGLNVRQTEDLVARLQHSSTQAPAKSATGKPAEARDVHVASLESKLQERFGTKVAVSARPTMVAVKVGTILLGSVSCASQ